MYYFKIDVSFRRMKPCAGLHRRAVDLRGGPGQREVELACVFSMHANAAHRAYTHAHIASPGVYLRIVNPHPHSPVKLLPPSLYLSIYYTHVCACRRRRINRSPDSYSARVTD